MSVAPLPGSDPAMQLSRLASIQAALRRADPDAQVALDPDSGKMKVLTVLPPDEVVRLLQGLGEVAELLDGEPDPEPATGGSCGCGCGSGR